MIRKNLRDINACMEDDEELLFFKNTGKREDLKKVL